MDLSRLKKIKNNNFEERKKKKRGTSREVE
jgi:hypothetical protein